MTYEEFMTRPLRISLRISHQLDDVAVKASIAMRVTTSFGEKTSSSQDNKSEKNVLRYVEAKRVLDSLMDDLDVAKDEVRVFLYENLPLEFADILEWKYIDGKSLQDIADMKSMTYQALRNKMSEGDRKARKIYDIRYK